MNWETILAVAGGVVVLGNCFKTLAGWLAPAKKLAETVAEHDRKLRADNERLEQLEADNQMILKSLFALVNHDIDGNGIERLKVTREELQDYITNR